MAGRIAVATVVWAATQDGFVEYTSGKLLVTALNLSSDFNKLLFNTLHLLSDRILVGPFDSKVDLAGDAFPPNHEAKLAGELSEQVESALGAHHSLQACPMGPCQKSGSNRVRANIPAGSPLQKDWEVIERILIGRHLQKMGRSATMLSS